MSRSHAVRNGFGAVFREPGLFAAELAWRWTFWAAAWLLLAYALLMFLQSLPVSDRDYFGLIGPIPGTAKTALANIFQGSGPKLLRLAIALYAGLSVLWWFAASAGRSATLRVLLPEGRGGPASISRLHAVRVFLTFIAVLAYVGTYAVASIFSVQPDHTRDQERFLIIVLPLFFVVGVAWSALNWYLSLAPIIAMQYGTNTLGSMRESAAMLRKSSTQLAWVSFCFGVARYLMGIFAFLALLVLLSFAVQLPLPGAILVLLVWAAAFSFASTFFATARLAAMVRVVRWSPEQSGSAF
jgi:hypothetical protein